MWSRYCGRLSRFLSRRDLRRYLFRKSTPHHIWRMFTLTCFVTRSKLPGEQRSNNFEDEDDDEYENDCLWPCAAAARLLAPTQGTKLTFTDWLLSDASWKASRADLSGMRWVINGCTLIRPFSKRRTACVYS